MHGQKTVRNIDDFYPTILVVILNMNGLDTQLKERILGWIKKVILNYMQETHCKY